MRMPVGAAIEETGILPPLSYYKVAVPVAPLPRALNEEAIRAGSVFLQEQEQRRFLAMAFVESYGTLDWLAKAAGANTLCVSCGYSTASKCWNLYPVLRGIPRPEPHIPQPVYSTTVQQKVNR